jgi:Tol biopolymer transport system component
MALRSAARLAIVGAIAAGIGACASDKASGPASGILIVGGNNQTDTIDGTMPRPLVVHAAPHQIIWVTLITDNVPVLYASQFDTADANGNVSITVVAGEHVGSAQLGLALTGSAVNGHSDTARYTITPGNTASIRITPHDTAAYVNHPITLADTAVDRLGNRRSDPVSLAIASGSATISGTTVTGTAYSRVAIVGTSGSVADTAYLSVVPHGTLAAAGNTVGIVTFNLDGSGYQLVAHQLAGQLRWSPDGTRLVFDRLGVLDITDLAGNVTTIEAGSGDYTDLNAVYSRDGQWIYFARVPAGFDPTTGSSLWRIHPDGTGLASLSVQGTSTSNGLPSPSPDGTQLAYVTYPGGATDVRVLTIATGAYTSLNIRATDPAWSPNSSMIASIISILAPGPIGLLDASGGPGAPVTSNNYLGEFDWSPDGQWLAAANPMTGGIDLINVASGLTLPLAYTNLGLQSPAWQPGSMTAARVSPRKLEHATTRARLDRRQPRARGLPR